MKEDPSRGTGRTTALMMTVLAKASSSPGEWIEFHDHYQHWRNHAHIFAKTIKGLAKGTGLNYDVRLEPHQKRVFVVAPIQQPVTDTYDDAIPPVPATSG